jgi:hypothetical protein
MPEAGQYIFSYREVVESLLKKQNIHEGIWQLSVKFGMQATNVGPNASMLTPSAMIGLIEIGLQKVETESNLAVDAAKVNPAPQAAARASRR